MTANRDDLLGTNKSSARPTRVCCVLLYHLSAPPGSARVPEMVTRSLRWVATHPPCNTRSQIADAFARHHTIIAIVIVAFHASWRPYALVSAVASGPSPCSLADGNTVLELSQLQ